MMVVSFFIHNKNGEIIRNGQCPRSMLRIQNRSGESSVEGIADDETQFYDVRSKTLRYKHRIYPVIERTKIIADGKDELVISSLPVPCRFYIERTRIDVDDGVLELTIDQAGIYKIKVTATNHLPWESEIEAQFAG